MVFRLTLLMLIILVQGCTVVGAIIDSKFPPANQHDKSLPMSQAGLAIDTAVVKSVVYDEPLSRPVKKDKSCKDLKKDQKKQCYATAEQVSESIKKYTNK